LHTIDKCVIIVPMSNQETRPVTEISDDQIRAGIIQLEAETRGSIFGDAEHVGEALAAVNVMRHAQAHIYEAATSETEVSTKDTIKVIRSIDRLNLALERRLLTLHEFAVDALHARASNRQDNQKEPE